MEEMQQPVEENQTGLQEAQAEPTNEELLRGLMGLKTSTQPENVESQQEPVDEPEPLGDESKQEDTSKSFYTLDELASWNYDEQGDIDTSRIPPEIMPIYKTLQKGYTKKKSKTSRRKETV